MFRTIADPYIQTQASLATVNGSAVDYAILRGYQASKILYALTLWGVALFTCYLILSPKRGLFNKNQNEK